MSVLDNVDAVLCPPRPGGKLDYPNVASFATHDEAGDTAMQDGTIDLVHNSTKPIERSHHALDNVASIQGLSETPESQLAENDGQDLDGNVTLRLYITDLELQCTTEGFDFPPVDTVGLAIIGLATGAEVVWLLRRVSEDTWKQVSSVIELSMDISRGLSIVATSEDSMVFARISLTKDELALDEETDEARITKYFAAGSGVSPLKLSLVVFGSSEKKMMDEDISDNECAETAWELASRGDDLMEIFERVGNLADLAEAISVQQRAIQLTPNGHADIPMYLNDLGYSFECRFERAGNLPDIEQAISLRQQAMQLTPNGHADMPMYLNNLGISYRRCFQCTGELSDISKATSLQQQAVELTPNGHADLPMYLNNLGNSYGCFFERTGKISSILEAISAQQRAVELIPNGHAHMPGCLNNLGNSY